MYGFPSKSALGTRRSKWTPDQHDRHNGGGAANALARALSDTTKSAGDAPIFSAVKDDPYTIDATDDGESRGLTKGSSATITHVLKQQASIIQRLEELEQTVERLKAELDTQVVSLQSSTAGVTPAIVETLAMDAPADDEKSVVPTFIPYFIKDSYTGRDNATNLEGDKLTMTVEILNYYPDPPVVYPFGAATGLPKFSDLTINCSITDLDHKISGTVYGHFKRGPNGTYTIALTELYVDGETTTFDKCPYPIILKCTTQLVLE
jgi:hypothetical protein